QPTLMRSKLRHGQRSGRRRVGREDRPGGVTLIRRVGAHVHHDLAVHPVRAHDPADDELHGRRDQYASTMSTRTPRPPTDVITWRRALAVRPPRPITVPRSSG